MAYRVARSLNVLLGQLNNMAPKRSTASDGALGDQSHKARASDHNPSGGVVHARDFTHDPHDGLDCNVLANQLVASGDSRIKYVIWNRKKTYWGRTLFFKKVLKWRKYTGVNPHNHHLHLSVNSGASGDDARRWNLPMFGFKPPAKPKPKPEAHKPVITQPSNPVYKEDEGMFVRNKETGATIHFAGETWRNVTATWPVHAGLGKAKISKDHFWTTAQINAWIKALDLIQHPASDKKP